MIRTSIAAGLGWALVFAAAMTFPGCVYTHDRLSESGMIVSDETLQQVEIGVTKREWIIATLGEPTSVNLVSQDPRIEVLRYAHAVDRSEGGWFILFGTDKDRKFTRNTFFEVTDGVVTRHWRDAPPDLKPQS